MPKRVESFGCAQVAIDNIDGFAYSEDSALAYIRLREITVYEHGATLSPDSSISLAEESDVTGFYAEQLLAYWYTRLSGVYLLK